MSDDSTMILNAVVLLAVGVMAVVFISQLVRWPRETVMVACVLATCWMALRLYGQTAPQTATAAPAPTAARTSTAELRRELVLHLKGLAAESLIDPESARFRNLRWNAKIHSLCGEINGKNRYGAYVGFQPFVVAVNTTGGYDVKILKHDPEPILQGYNDKIWAIVCADSVAYTE